MQYWIGLAIHGHYSLSEKAIPRTPLMGGLRWTTTHGHLTDARLACHSLRKRSHAVGRAGVIEVIKNTFTCVPKRQAAACRRTESVDVYVYRTAVDRQQNAGDTSLQHMAKDWGCGYV